MEELTGEFTDDEDDTPSNPLPLSCFSAPPEDNENEENQLDSTQCCVEPLVQDKEKKASSKKLPKSPETSPRKKKFTKRVPVNRNAVSNPLPPSCYVAPPKDEENKENSSNTIPQISFELPPQIKKKRQINKKN